MKRNRPGENLLSVLGEGNWFAGDTPVTENDTVPLNCTEFCRAYSVNTLVTPFADGGSISVDKSLAKPGDTVSISAQAFANYVNKGLSVVDAENNPVSVNGASFVMPASDVTVQLQLARILEVVDSLGGVALITADHGNADEMCEIDKKTGEPKLDKDGNMKSKTSHTLNPVPCIIYDNKFADNYKVVEKDSYGLSNIAATLVNLMGYEAPEIWDESMIEVL